MAEGGREGSMKVGDGGISNTVEIRGFSKKTSQELMEMYFENSRRSGGGDLEEVKIRDEVAYITFKDPEVAHNVASRSSHQLDGHTLTVTLFHPLPPKPCYQNRVLIQGLNNAITEELLINFLETKTKTEVTELLYGELDGNVVVTFSNNIDIVQLGKIFQKSSIEGVFLNVERVEISNCILVQNLHPSSSYDAILYYFENKRRSGGGDVERVEMKTEERYCLIYFEDPSVIDRVLERQSHSVDGVNFEIHLHHECLGRRSSRNKSDLYLRVSSPGNKDSSSLEYENTGNRAKYKTSGSVSSDPENESDFAEVQERQEENGKEKLDILLRYRKTSGAQFVNKTITLPCTEDFLRYWNFYTKTSEGKQMLDVIARTHQCSVAVSNDVEDLFIFEAIDQCFKQVSDIEEFVNMVIHSVYQNAQTSLCLCCFSVEVVIQDDFFQRVKQRKDMDVFWIAKGGEHNSAAMYAVSRKENKEIMTGKITEIIDTAQKCFENHEEKVHADNIWKRVMEKFILRK